MKKYALSQMVPPLSRNESLIYPNNKKEKYIDSRSYFSWERYFTDLLITETGDSYLKYQKAKLNLAYLHERNKDIILKSIKGISF